MAENKDLDETVNRVLLHLYNSVVVGSINSVALMLRIATAAPAAPPNPRREDLKQLYDLLGPEGRELFYGAVTSVAEFAVYRVLDFVEQYSDFDSQDNDSDFPRLSLVYTELVNGNEHPLVLSNFGTENLGQRFKKIARNNEVQELVESAIHQAPGSAPAT